MKANENKIIQFYSVRNTQFCIPVYQRNYNWEEKQCKVLLKDILNIAKNTEEPSHFIGSIVYIQENIQCTVGRREFNVIDGQQRITTISLLFIALCHKYQDFGEMQKRDRIYNQYLYDEYMDGSNKIKLLPPGENFNIFKSILEKNMDVSKIKDSNLYKNYKFFLDKLDTVEKMDRIVLGIEKLMFVEVVLEKDRDNPQRIFESLNSTGLDLSQADLIRNFILMDVDRETQIKLYEDFWVEIEKNTKIVNDINVDIRISDFMRDYLILKLGEIPNKNGVFEKFKDVYEDFTKEQLYEELDIMLKYSKIYRNIIRPEKESNSRVSKQLYYLKMLKNNVVNPFLMGIYDDYNIGILLEDEFISILDLLQSYLWRRYICEEKSTTSNIFSNLYLKIDREDYYGSIEKILAHQKFPSNDDLKESLKIKSIYKDKEKLMYLFERIENETHKEKIDFENLTIEHIFPIKPNKQWKELFSSEEYEKMVTFRNTLANLTLTAYNSSLGNKCFLEKRDTPIVGYKDSKLFLNKWISNQNEWNLIKLDERFEELFSVIIDIWKAPNMKIEEEIKEVNNKVFYCMSVGRGSGIGRLLSGKKFLIAKGSKGSKIITGSSSVSNLQAINRLINDGVILEEENYYVFVKDYVCNSPTEASRLILGRNSSGWQEWRTKDGILLQNYKNKQV